MAHENWQKMKMLKLVELLRQETDEQHPLTTSDICEKLENIGIPCERRTLSKDIALLNDEGIEVLWTWVGKEKGYYIEDRSFSVPEIKILIDAVQAASFITEKKTAELIEKIADLGGTHRADILKDNIVHFNTRKHSNESILYNVDSIETALQQQKKIIFRYFDLDASASRVYRRDGHHYVVEPVALVFNEDNYYLVAYSSRHDNTTNYRVDRMETVEVIDESVCNHAVELRNEIGSYTEQAIKMFSGKVEDVVLQFDKSLVGAVFDRFGERIHMIPSGDSCIANVKVQLSPTFWGWLFQFENKMKILAPETVVLSFKQIYSQAVTQQ